MRVGPEPTTDKYICCPSKPFYISQKLISLFHPLLLHGCLLLFQVHHRVPRLLQCSSSRTRPGNGLRETVCALGQVWVFIPQQVKKVSLYIKGYTMGCLDSPKMNEFPEKL